MTKTYIGVKMVTAWPETKDEREGYAVKYPDGYTSWSPKEVFEAAYLEISDASCITEDVVDDFLDSEPCDKARMRNHGVRCFETRSKFTLAEEAACVDGANYDVETATKLTRTKAESKVWFGLGFVLAWARNGLRPGE